MSSTSSSSSRLLIFCCYGVLWKDHRERGGHYSSVQAGFDFFVRDEERAIGGIFSSLVTPDECQQIDLVVDTITSDSCSSSLSTAVRNGDVIINCLSSYKATFN